MTPKEASEVIKQRGIEYGDATIGSVFKEECDVVDQALNELEELKHDVKRYFEITDQTWVKQEHISEHKPLKQKLMKVGNEE